MTQISSLSSRLFAIVFFDSDNPTSISDITLDDLIYANGNMEYLNAMQERIDNILDLGIGETYHMSFNRDDKNATGCVKRIK